MSTENRETWEAQSRQLAFLTALLCAAPALAQPGPAEPPDGATLFRRQCAACHALQASAPPRQGPHLQGVMGRQAGSVDGFKYSAGFATAGFAWTEATLDPYLTNPQAVIAGSNMAYRQANAATRRTIIEYLKDQ